MKNLGRRNKRGRYDDAMQRLANNRYRIVRPLGGGGMAEVYLAHDEALGRDVALKTLHRRYAGDGEFVERFRREARNAASLSHQHVVPIYDWGKTGDGTYYIAMEYVSGGTLKDRILRGRPLAPRMAVAFAIQIARGLEAAHRQGVIHRDIKPQNILTTASGDVKVADFGIAKAASLSSITRTGYVLGTERYMSPEQASGKSLTPRSDLYSLGVVLYEMLTGELPQKAAGPIRNLSKPSRKKSLRSPKEVAPEVPEDLSAITVRLLAEDPKRRYPDAASLVSDLEQVRDRLREPAKTRVLTSAVRRARTALKGRPPKTKPYSPPANLQRPKNIKGKVRKKSRRGVVTLVLLIALAFAAVLVLEGLASNSTTEPPAPPKTSRPTPPASRPAPSVPPAMPQPVPQDPSEPFVPSGGPGGAALPQVSPSEGSANPRQESPEEIAARIEEELERMSSREK